MSIKTIVAKGRKFDSAIGRTVVEQAQEIAKDVWDTFGENLTSEQAQNIGDGIGGDVGARVSEWKKFAMAVPYGMVEALGYMPAELLTRTRMFQLARRVYAAADYTHVKSTVDAYVTEIKTPKTGSGGAARSVSSLVKSVFNVKTRKRNEIAFRKELAQLCKKHGIKF